MTQRLRFAVFVPLLFGLAACGKKEPSAPAPDLSVPGRAEVEKVPAQAEVKASSGPVELSLLIYKTQIRVGESLWQQLRIRNVGTRPMTVVDQVFFDPWQLIRQSESGYATFIEASGPDGKPLKVARHSNWNNLGTDISDRPSGLLEVEGPEERTMLDGWKKQGLSFHDINLKLIDFNTKKRIAAELKTERPRVTLQPGEAVETKSWFFYSDWDKYKKRPAPQPIGDFAELKFFDFDKPGEYKIRAVYDLAPTKKLTEMRGTIPVEADEVLVRTPWITIQVRP